ncbi:hypothetical protein Cni_G16963 [Canna indica]|uniref:Uncharacterized protein n=1 Tax=Canna indica TaxID=4628 RepID=A0AAQ3QD33_9LILI|nr:hypothetical protein Cni_G16963 [Canna indica]
MKQVRRLAVETSCCSRVGLKRGPWSPEEDEVLASFMQREGEGQWRTLSMHAGLHHCCKSCRLRWMNYLRPSIKRGHITTDEEELILRLHRLLGNRHDARLSRWSLISRRIPGRTDNEIKNYWKTHLSKKLIKQGIDPRTHKPFASSSSTTPDYPAVNPNPIAKEAIVGATGEDDHFRCSDDLNFLSEWFAEVNQAGDELFSGLIFDSFSNHVDDIILMQEQTNNSCSAWFDFESSL